MESSKEIVVWSNTTFLFYVGIILICYFSGLSKYVKVKIRTPIGFTKLVVPELVIAFVLGFVKCFGTTGRDLRAGYYNNFLSATSISNFHDYTVEVGFRFINVMIRSFTDNYGIFIFIIGLMSLYPVIHFLKKYRDSIDLPIAILMYVSMFFFYSLSLMRITLAAAIALYGFDQIIEKKPLKALAYILIASTVHSTALILVIPYIFIFENYHKKTISMFIALIILIAYVGRNNFLVLLLNSERYNIYDVSQTVTFGLEQFVYFIPMFIILYIGNKYILDEYIKNVSFSIIAVAFMIGMLSYIVPILGRIIHIFLPLMLIIPCYIKQIKKERPQLKMVLNLLVLVYCFSRFYIYITQYYDIDDMMPYTNIFSWVI